MTTGLSLSRLDVSLTSDITENVVLKSNYSGYLVFSSYTDSNAANSFDVMIGYKPDWGLKVETPLGDAKESIILLKGIRFGNGHALSIWGVDWKLDFGNRYLMHDSAELTFRNGGWVLINKYLIGYRFPAGYSLKGGFMSGMSNGPEGFEYTEMGFTVGVETTF